MPSTSEEIVSVGGRRLRISNLDKILYPESGTTKAEILHYYLEIAPLLIRYTRDRPATRKRWVNGVGTASEPATAFFQKNLDDGTPSWVLRRPIEHSRQRVEYPLVNDVATVAWLAQVAALEIHVPQWKFGRTGEERNPDRMVLDLDPGPGAGLAECAQVARWIRPILHEMRLDAHPVTSGSKGIHLYSALDGRYTSDQISAVAHELARALEADHPDLIVSDMKKSRREGKVLVDWSQNNAAKTTVAPYSLRGRPLPTVAAPRTWDELDEPGLANLTFSELLERIPETGDLLSALLATTDAGLEPTTSTMATFEPTPESRDRLATYRSMRNSAATPEPVPPPPSISESADSPDLAVVLGSGRSFVIQEHHARRLHYDFRLEHDGVLVSWAVPKGPPLSTKENRLAVQTEDHPLEYGTFEGTIPAGQYGAGQVTIWDAGTVNVEKWREGKEVIATLHGRPDGGLGGVPRKYALIHTGAGGGTNWLVHLMKDNPGGDGEAIPPHSHSAIVPITPMLATAGSLAEVSGDGWAYEMKWDGYRAVVYVRGADVQIFSRNGKSLTAMFPDLLVPIRDALVSDDAVLDGEIVAINHEGRPDFGLLQTRAGLTRSDEVEHALQRTPVELMLFDILSFDGRDLTDEPYDRRRTALDSLVTENRKVHRPPALEGQASDALETSRDLHLEGVVAKARDSTYRPGRRSRAWIKIKLQRMQEVVVVGWQEGRGALAGTVGSLLMAVPDGTVLRYAGKVGSGFTDDQRDAMLKQFRRLEQDSPPLGGVPAVEARAATWITPTLVGEVAFAEWTTSATLRQATWRGWRPDKSPEEVRRES